MMTLIRGSAELMHQRGAQFGWSYGEVEEMRTLLTHGLIGYMRVFMTSRHSINREELDKAIDTFEQYLTKFTKRYTQLMQREQGPFTGCRYCPKRCQYRTDTKYLLTEKNRKWINDELTNSAHTNLTQRYSAVVNATSSIAQSWLGEEVGSPAKDEVAGVAYCAYLHTIATNNFSEYEQAILSNGAKDYFFSDTSTRSEEEDTEDDDNDEEMYDDF
jgi:hypothetical protein